MHTQQNKVKLVNSSLYYSSGAFQKPLEFARPMKVKFLKCNCLLCGSDTIVYAYLGRY